ncbi:MAG: Holliday junction branch migration protein RuvA [Opitutales bacterium]
MIAFVEGTLESAEPLRCIVVAGGLGYEVHIPLTTAEALPPLGQTVRLHTLAVYREDSATLYGFVRTEDRAFFQLLVEKVSGIGPKIALSILSRLSVPTLRQAVAASDVPLLAKCPGIGKKTAERLVMELRDKVGALPDSPTAEAGSVAARETGQIPVAPSTFEDAVAALITLGYKPPEADKAIRKARDAIGTDVSTDALVRQALK